ncbi:hypothetical protein MKW98_008916 [Papaver atlanticum]|uniref:serine C-palmitoyltransferase n=1 Tax=Papaver atlanticum TaxID=357466 RepID=A0AAD4S2C4_9MAGN|nr:hypothetical protein MKW98_008916 [Papaver atlanticum]
MPTWYPLLLTKFRDISPSPVWLSKIKTKVFFNGLNLEASYPEDCFNRPIASAPDSWIEVVERYSNDHNKTLKRTTSTRRSLVWTAEQQHCTRNWKNVLLALLEKRLLWLLVWGALVRAFQHNSPSHLEKVLREAIAEGEGNADGQLLTHRPWKKIIVVVEGIYSMEGDLCRLPEIIAVCKKYKAYTYLDEAHSIGAVGKSGRGVCEFLGVDTADVDIMMGTFSKSFGSCGGYIAASKEVIEYLKLTCPAHLYATAISPPAAQQILSSIKNSNFFRSELQKMGFQVIGDNDSPVMPIMVYNPAKISAFSREFFKRNVAVVAVGYPAIKQLMLARVRICISASHTREDLLTALEVISQVGDQVGIKYFPAEPKKQQCKGRLKLDEERNVISNEETLN